MSGTYRYQVCITRDGEGRHGATARGGAAEMKKIDRRAKRRQEARITRDALREHDDNEAFDMQEAMQSAYDDFDSWACEEDFNDDYWDGDYGSHPGDEDLDLSYCDSYWESYAEADEYYHRRNYPLHDDFDFREELKCPAEKQAVQEGVSLGDILARIRKEKGLD